MWALYCSACTRARAWDTCPRPRRPPGAAESHIHGIYGGIALLEHLRTMTAHLDALLRARRAIRVMHRNASSSDSLAISSHCYAKNAARVRVGPRNSLRKPIDFTLPASALLLALLSLHCRLRKGRALRYARGFRGMRLVFRLLRKLRARIYD